VNANDATLTELATTQSGSMVHDDAPNAPASGGFDLIIGAAAGSALGSSGAPYTLTISAIDLTTVSQPWPPQILHQAFDAASGWKLSGTGPDYETTQTIPTTVPGGPGGLLAGHALQFVASLVSQGAQIAGQSRWLVVSAHRLVALVRAGARFARPVRGTRSHRALAVRESGCLRRIRRAVIGDETAKAEGGVMRQGHEAVAARL
jgi:hypothetical protein